MKKLTISNFRSGKNPNRVRIDLGECTLKEVDTILGCYSYDVARIIFNDDKSISILKHEAESVSQLLETKGFEVSKKFI